MTPEYTSTNRNLYREWIGAQIRADGWGYASAGNPERAAELAYRDACWTHRANGIYGEMMFAAIMAAVLDLHCQFRYPLGVHATRLTIGGPCLTSRTM